MTDEEFSLGVDAILSVPVRGHVQHRALDLWWVRYATEKGGPLEDATRKWMAAIEGDHKPGTPYPLGARRSLACMVGLHRWRIGPDNKTGWGLDGRTCIRCRKHEGAGSPCP